LESVIALLKAYGLAASSWIQQGSKLVGTGNTGSSRQGTSVSLSGDTLAVGSYNDNGGMGAVWIFVRSGSTWTQQGSTLVGSDISANAQFGYSVCLRGDTLAVGGYLDDGND